MTSVKETNSWFKIYINMYICTWLYNQIIYLFDYLIIFETMKSTPFRYNLWVVYRENPRFGPLPWLCATLWHGNSRWDLQQKGLRLSHWGWLQLRHDQSPCSATKGLPCGGLLWKLDDFLWYVWLNNWEEMSNQTWDVFIISQYDLLQSQNKCI